MYIGKHIYFLILVDNFSELKVTNQCNSNCSHSSALENQENQHIKPDKQCQMKMLEGARAPLDPLYMSLWPY